MKAERSEVFTAQGAQATGPSGPLSGTEGSQ